MEEKRKSSEKKLKMQNKSLTDENQRILNQIDANNEKYIKLSR